MQPQLMQAQPTQSRLTFPVLAAIVLTIAFDLLVIAVGGGMVLNAIFAGYACIIILLGTLDRRAFGYATILSVCSPANSLANLSYPVLMSLITIVASQQSISGTVSRLARTGWWPMWAGVAVVASLMAPMWVGSLREILTEIKMMLSHTGMLALVSVAVFMTFHDVKDSLRACVLVCLLTAAIVAVFYFVGRAGVPDAAAFGMRSRSREIYMSLGAAYINFNRTQVCILFAGVAVASLALAAGLLRRLPVALMLLGASGISVYLVMQLASTGSAFAMVMGMAVVALGYLMLKPSALRWLMGISLFAVVGWTLLWAVFQTENKLAHRIQEKVTYGHIDRWEAWVFSVNVIADRPAGTGWTTEYAVAQHAHNDFFVYFLSWGWTAGILYTGGVVWLALSLVRAIFRYSSASANRDIHALLLAGTGVLAVYCVNSMLDMLSANLWFYQTVWMLVLVPAVALLQAPSGEDQASSQESRWMAEPLAY